MSGMVLSPASSGGQGSKTITTAATPLQLSATSVACRSVAITARPGNTGKIAIGWSNLVRATAGAEVGMILAAGATIVLAISDLQYIWLDTSVNAEGVSYTYFV